MIRRPLSVFGLRCSVVLLGAFGTAPRVTAIMKAPSPGDFGVLTCCRSVAGVLLIVAGRRRMQRGGVIGFIVHGLWPQK